MAKSYYLDNAVLQAVLAAVPYTSPSAVYVALYTSAPGPTGGASAQLAQAWRQRLEKLIGPEWGLLAELLEAKRRRLLKTTANPARRRRILVAMGALKFARLLKRQGRRAASRAMNRLIRLGIGD